MKHYLQHRANINTIYFKGKKVVIYEDHRYILNVLKFYKINSKWKFPIDVIYFDFHDDCYKNDSILTGKQIKKVKKFKFEKFYNHVEFEHSTQDDDWLISGFEYGLIRHGINILGQEINHINELNGLYMDSFCNNHKVISIPFDSNKRIRKNIDIYNQVIQNNFLLDFDLDFMTQLINGKNIAYNNDELYSLFNQELTDGNVLKEATKELIERAKIITICMESKFCGGFNASNRLLQFLNENFFDNSLNEIM